MFAFVYDSVIRGGT